MPRDELGRLLLQSVAVEAAVGSDEQQSETTATERRGAGARRGPQISWIQLIVLGLAVLWLGGVLGFGFTSWAGRPGADSAEVGYLQDMITHHEQALAMANYELANGELPEVQIFAREILLQQSYEIGVMEAKLREWGYLRSERPATAMGWMGMGMPVDSMPGLATEAQMETLRDARGIEADRLFFELMAAHHRGGVDMGRAGAERASDDWVQELAGRQANNQVIEINEFILTAERVDLDVDIEPYE